MAVEGPTLSRRRLARLLRQLREDAGLKAADVIKSRDNPRGVVGRSTFHRVESGTAPIGVPIAIALAVRYGADQAQIDAVAELAHSSQQRGWWQDFGDVTPSFITYVDLEAQASRIATYQPLVPGILQTPRYARAIEQETSLGEVDDDAIERTVALRGKRQEAALERRLTITAVLDEAALHREVGGRAVLDDQVRRLSELTARPGINIRVLPWDAGAHPADWGRFTILDFEDENDPPIWYVETYFGAHFGEEPHQVSRARDILTEVERKSISIREYLA